MTRTLKPLTGFRIVSTAINIPGPLALARLCSLGATAVKVEPPGGDLLASACPSWYEELHLGVEVVSLDLKDKNNIRKLELFLDEADLLLTSSRLASLERLGLGWPFLSSRFPKLLQVAIIGHHPPDDHIPVHDLTIQADLGLLDPPQLPKTLVADLAGAERAVSTALSLILSWKVEASGSPAADHDRIAYVSLAEAASTFAIPPKYGLTGSDNPLGGLLPGYYIYRAKEGWVVVAALEEHFRKRFAHEFTLGQITHTNLANLFNQRPAQEWEKWAVENDFPIVGVKDVGNIRSKKDD